MGVLAHQVLGDALRKPATSHAIGLALAATRELFDQGLRSPPSTPKSSTASDLVPLPSFMKHVSRRARCTVGTMLVTYVYIKRLRTKLGSVPVPSTAPCALHRVIFSATMIAHKMWNDSSMVGKHWAEVSDMFDAKELLKMERDFLRLLNYDVLLSPNEVVCFAPTFLKSSIPRLVNHAEVQYPSLKDEKPPFRGSFISPPPSPVRIHESYPKSAVKRRPSPTHI